MRVIFWFMRVIFCSWGLYSGSWVICIPYSMLTTSFPRERDVVKICYRKWNSGVLLYATHENYKFQMFTPSMHQISEPPFTPTMLYLVGHLGFLPPDIFHVALCNQKNNPHHILLLLAPMYVIFGALNVHWGTSGWEARTHALPSLWAEYVLGSHWSIIHSTIKV